MNFLSNIVAEISLTKNMKRKIEGHIQGRINRRMPVLNPTMQQLSVNLHTKYQHSILKSAEKFIAKNCSIDCMERQKR